MEQFQNRFKALSYNEFRRRWTAGMAVPHNTNIYDYAMTCNHKLQILSYYTGMPEKYIYKYLKYKNLKYDSENGIIFYYENNNSRFAFVAWPENNKTIFRMSIDGTFRLATRIVLHKDIPAPSEYKENFERTFELLKILPI